MMPAARRVALVAVLVVLSAAVGGGLAARVVGSARSDVYHRPDCRHAAAITARNFVEWPSPAAALADDYRACLVCLP